MQTSKRGSRSPHRHLRSSPQSSTSKPGFNYPSDKELSKEVQEYMDQLGTMCRPEQIKDSPPGFEGVFLEPVKMEFKTRHGKGSDDYKNTTLEYSGYLERTKAFLATRQIFCKGLANNPTTRALALLALSKGSVKMMEKGLAPSGMFYKYMPTDYNRHHIAQKSGRPSDGRPINHFSNLVLINSGATGEWRSDPNSSSYTPALDPNCPEFNPARAQRPDLNAHHFFHGALLVSQTELTTGTQKTSTVYCPRPAFPVFPPISRSIGPLSTRKEVLNKLDQLEPGILSKLPKSFNIWADKLVAFSEACNHQYYTVPHPYHGATLGYTHVYENSRIPKETLETLSAKELKALESTIEKQQDERRSQMARDYERTAASFLPENGVVNGKKVSTVLREAQEQGEPIKYQPIPLVPEGWKPLKSYHRPFPSIQRVHQNMEEAGLANKIPSQRHSDKPHLLDSLCSMPFISRTLDKFRNSTGISKKISHGNIK